MNSVEIINYSDEYKTAIKQLNIEWLEKYFAVLPMDELQLSNPQKEIINKGGLIFYAKYNNEIVGTAALLKVDGATYELSKMAVNYNSQGFGIGKKLIEHCIKTAVENKIEKLILYSSTKLETAIAIYKKYGFVETPMDATHYERANIKMKLNLNEFYKYNFNNKTFALIQNSKNGQVSTETIFKYKQEGNLVTADYFGGSVRYGKIIAHLDNDNMNMLYQCLTTSDELKAGKALAKITLTAEGKIRLKLNWEWLANGNEKGESEYIEID